MSDAPKTQGPWQLARAEKVSAFYSGEHLTIVVEGQKPSTCHRLDLERSLLDVEPPAFTFRWRAEGICPWMMVPFKYAESFFTAPRREVKVRTAEGVQLVKVQPVAPLSLEPMGGGGEVPVPFGGGGDVPLPFGGKQDDSNEAWAAAAKAGGLKPVEAVGYSEVYSFEEALRAAIANLPAGKPPHPDALTTVHVVATGVQIGGFVGFNRLFVKVRAFTS